MTRPTSRLHFQSLESRIVVFFVVLLMLVQMAGFFAIRYTIGQSARNNLQEELNVGQRVFKRLLEQNSQQLVEATSVLTYDFGFREAIASQDKATILSALNNHSRRIKATGMALVSLQNTVIADTLLANRTGNPFTFPELIAQAAEQRRASAVRLIDGTVYQIVVVPVLAPLPIAWVAMLFVIDDTTAGELKRITGLDVSFIGSNAAGPTEILATTLPPFLREQAQVSLAGVAHHVDGRTTLRLGEDEFETLTTTIESYGDTRVIALLQRSLREGMEPYAALQVVLLFLAAVSLMVTLAGSIRIARRITRPVTALANAARRVARGEHANVGAAASGQHDEIGELATAFNNMSRGLTERDQMRDILGKVASPAVAEQLLSQKIELGGEERIVTVLFADIRDFTALCESQTPHRSLDLLNRYLGRISTVIEKHGGIIDKFTGDGVMALFGAPIAGTDDAERAVHAALEILDRIRDLSRELAAEGLPCPDVGIGINTSRVIAGNIGTASRLNYTVLGDGVNLAARLEGLTKRYAVPLIVGEETMKCVTGLIYRELDKVRVKGKSVPVRIFQPMGRAEQIDAGQLSILAKYHDAIEAYRARQWPRAAETFSLLQSDESYRRICELYMGYIDQFQQMPPSGTWDGSFTLYEK